MHARCVTQLLLCVHPATPPLCRACCGHIAGHQMPRDGRWCWSWELTPTYTPPHTPRWSACAAERRRLASHARACFAARRGRRHLRLARGRCNLLAHRTHESLVTMESWSHHGIVNERVIRVSFGREGRCQTKSWVSLMMRWASRITQIDIRSVSVNRPMHSPMQSVHSHANAARAAAARRASSVLGRPSKPPPGSRQWRKNTHTAHTKADSRLPPQRQHMHSNALDAGVTRPAALHAHNTRTATCTRTEKREREALTRPATAEHLWRAAAPLASMRLLRARVHASPSRVASAAGVHHESTNRALVRRVKAAESSDARILVVVFICESTTAVHRGVLPRGMHPPRMPGEGGSKPAVQPAPPFRCSSSTSLRQSSPHAAACGARPCWTNALTMHAGVAGSAVSMHLCARGCVRHAAACNQSRPPRHNTVPDNNGSARAPHLPPSQRLAVLCSAQVCRQSCMQRSVLHAKTHARCAQPCTTCASALQHPQMLL